MLRDQFGMTTTAGDDSGDYQEPEKPSRPEPKQCLYCYYVEGDIKAIMADELRAHCRVERDGTIGGICTTTGQTREDAESAERRQRQIIGRYGRDW